MNHIIVILLILTIIPVFITMIFIPYWTRKTESFGVSIPEQIYDNLKIKKMRKQYAFIMSFLSIIFTVIFVLLSFYFSNDEKILSIVIGTIITVYIINSFFVYLYFHRKMTNLKHAENWGQDKSEQIVIDTKFRNQKIVYSNRWFVLSFIISFITIVFTLQFYHKIPEKIPLQYNFLGEITNWTDKSYRSVLIMPIMQVYMTLLFLFINTMIAKAKQQVSAENPEKSMIQNITFRRRWSLFIIITGTALVLMFSMIQLSFIYPINQTILLIIPLTISFGTLIGAIALSITTGQGGSRIGKSESKSGEFIDRDDDEHWKLGQFYFNKEDPSLFLEKRFGVGWTNNWARPLSWIILLAIILLAAGIPILLTI